MNKSIYILFFGILVLMSSCRKDFDTVPSSGKLTFSKQTVYLDTVFTNIGSSTYTLKVFNRSNKDITIPKIKLAKPDSKYRITVDGMTGDTGNQGKVFSNVELLAKDSLYIFIETTVNIAEANPTDFLYTDEIEFDSGSNLQKVNLVTLIQDAIFLYPEKYTDGTKESILLGTDNDGTQYRVTGFELDENDPIHGNELHFTNTKPYVIYGFAGVPNGKTLTIDSGAKVHFHSESGILVQPGGSLNVAGTPSTYDAEGKVVINNEVTFEGDRLEPSFEDTPGQWFAVWLQQGSVNNTIEHLTLKNATIGILAENCPLSINNSQIYNSSNIGILGREATVSGTNLVINNSGQACFAGSQGGNYDFTHCTFNNNWNSTEQVAVSLENYYLDKNNNPITFNLVKADFKNCIIYGSNNVEMTLYKNDSTQFLFSFDHCLIKFNDFGTKLVDDENYNSIRDNNSGNYLNEEPLFYKPNKNKLYINEDSFATKKGFNLGLSVDVLGKPRTSNPPDLGAYQSAAFPQ